MEAQYISRKEAAKALCVSVDTIDRLANMGELRRRKIGARTVFYIPEIRAFAEELVRKGAVSLA